VARLTNARQDIDGGQWRSSVTCDLIGRVREEVSAAASRNRFVDLLEAGDVPRDRLTWLAGEQFRIVGSDQRSFALLAARFPDPPAGEMFLALAQGELRALRLLADFAAALGWAERDLRAYEPRPLAQAYPAYLAWSALFGTCSGVALAMLANLQEWGGSCGRVAEALVTATACPSGPSGSSGSSPPRRRDSPSRRRPSWPPGWPPVKIRGRRCGRPWPCTRTRSRSGTRSPPAFAMDREDHERTIAADLGGSSASGLCICDRP